MSATGSIQAGTRAYYKLAVILGSLAAMGPLAIDMYLPSFPTIANDLGSTPAAMEGTAAAYFVGLALGQSIYGPLTDRLGRKRPLYFGLSLFIVASVGCAFANSVPQLTALRTLQALGGCAEMVVARAMVRDYFDQRDSVRVLSLLILVMGLAPILAPLVGGQLLLHLGWRSVFYALAAYALVSLLAVVVFLRESLPVERRRSDSVREVARVYGRLLTNRSFMAHVVCGGLVISGMFAYIAGSPFVFIELFGVSPERYGLFFGANAFGLIAASQVNGRLARRVEPGRLLSNVLPVTALASLVLLFTAWTGTGGFAGLLVPLFVCVASVGFVVPNTMVLAMAPHGRVAGTASALLGTIQFGLGAAAGAAVSSLNNGTSVPLGVVIAFCGVGALLTYLLVPNAKPGAAS
jgi:DHA1 family bicyclomycin/chloramphenicol resistance-like MFS transporter